MTEPRILRTRDVLRITGISRSTLWRRIRDGSFPAGFRLGGRGSRCVGWREGDVLAWLESRERVGQR